MFAAKLNDVRGDLVKKLKVDSGLLSYMPDKVVNSKQKTEIQRVCTTLLLVSL